MPNKQIFINLDRTILEELKDKAANIEKRSLNSLCRKLIADLPHDRAALLELGDSLRNEHLVSLTSKNQIGSTIRISEDELWELKEKSAKSKMNPRDLIIGLLEVWNSGDPKSILSAREERNVVKRAS